jgi:hypothetical protein
MDHHRAAFERSGVDDFLVLPYLRPNILEDIGVASANDRNAIMRAVKRLQDLNEFQCTHSFSSSLAKRTICRTC